MDFCNENPNSNHPLETIIKSSSSYNGWFTSSNIRSSISAICNNLSSAKLSSWLSQYSIPIEEKRMFLLSWLVIFHWLVLMISYVF